MADVAHEIALIMAEHHRINPPGGKCTCGHETGLGQLVTRHVADAVLASGLVVSREAYDDMKRSLGRAADARERLAAQVAAVRALHLQDDGLLAPGKWCPACGDETPCATIRALTDQGGPA